MDADTGFRYVRKYMKIASCLAAALFVLAGCAPRPNIAVTHIGALPSAREFVLGGEADTNSAPPGILAGLAEKGFTPSADGALLLQVSDSARSAKTGLFLPDIPENAGGQPTWLSSPGTSKSAKIRRMVISFTDRASGREVYRVTGTEKFRPAQKMVGDPLMQAVLERLIASQ